MKRKKFLIYFAFLFVTFIIIGWYARIGDALSKPLSEEWLARNSALIVRGIVKDLRYEYNNPRGKMIGTYATVQVKEHIKHAIAGKQPPKEITVMIPGGVKGNRFLITVDKPVVKKGEEVLLFLRPLKRKSNLYAIWGFEGKYSIKNGVAVRDKVWTFMNVAVDMGLAKKRVNVGEVRRGMANFVTEVKRLAAAK